MQESHSQFAVEAKSRETSWFEADVIFLQKSILFWAELETDRTKSGALNEYQEDRSDLSDLTDLTELSNIADVPNIADPFKHINVSSSQVYSDKNPLKKEDNSEDSFQKVVEEKKRVNKRKRVKSTCPGESL